MDNSDAQLFTGGGLKVVVLAATPTGTGNDCVAVFSGADVNIGAGAITDWATRSAPASEAADGTSWKIRRRGRFLFTASVVVLAGVTVNAGLSFDGTAAQLITDPTPVDGPTRDFSRVTTPAGTLTPIKLACQINVTQVQANTPTLGILRLLLGDNAGAGPAGAALLLTHATLSIQEANDLNTRT